MGARDLPDFPLTDVDAAWFEALNQGAGSFPAGASVSSLSLERGLNKLKHRSIAGVNFSVTSTALHTLFVDTLAGQGQPRTLSEIDIDKFCDACKKAADAI